MAACRRRVMSPQGKRLTMICASLVLLQIMFAVHRFAQGAADWRSGPRWSIISVLCPVHPFATTWHFPSRGNEKIGGTGYCVTYDTDSQSRNVLASPLGEEGHEVAKGCTRVRMIMILDVDVTAERRHYNTHRPQGRYHNPRPERPSNLRTLRPQAGPS